MIIHTIISNKKTFDLISPNRAIKECSKIIYAKKSKTESIELFIQILNIFEDFLIQNLDALNKESLKTIQEVFMFCTIITKKVLYFYFQKLKLNLHALDIIKKNNPSMISFNKEKASKITEKINLASIENNENLDLHDIIEIQNLEIIKEYVCNNFLC